MEQLKLKGFSKFVAFLLIAAIVISVVVFAAEGNEATPNEPESGNGGTLSAETDENTDKNDQKDDLTDITTTPDTNEPEADEPTLPAYLNKLTGITVTEEEYNSTAFGVVIDPALPSYGLSYADLAIELPTETGNSRMLFYSSSSDTIWKFGALKPTRDYISSVARLFGGVLVSYGNDDKISYSAGSTEYSTLDISKHNDCFYIESETNVYTSENLINVANNRTLLSSSAHTYNDAPYKISESVVTSGIDGANNVLIPYSADNRTLLSYNPSTGVYQYIKNDEAKVDMLTGERISYDNVFVLFANTTTYENASASQLVVDTESGGKGYYLTKGKLTEFVWSVSEDGKLEFKNLMGEVLEVNTGTSYIAYYKASAASTVQIS